MLNKYILIKGLDSSPLSVRSNFFQWVHSKVKQMKFWVIWPLTPISCAITSFGIQNLSFCNFDPSGQFSIKMRVNPLVDFKFYAKAPKYPYI